MRGSSGGLAADLDHSAGADHGPAGDGAKLILHHEAFRPELNLKSGTRGYRSMDKLLFWLGIGAAQKGAGSNKRPDSRHWVVSLVAGTLLALLIAVGMFILLVSQK